MAAAPAYALQVYQALLKNGYSTAQAVGIMANMWAESRLDPEASAPDSGGTHSYGLVQFNSGAYGPKAATFVTGNPTADINSQVAYLAQVAGPKSSAAAGNSAQEVAGNWSAQFERCQGCQAGSTYPNGWSTRVANAGMVAGWARAGQWTVSSGMPGAGSGAQTGGTPGPGSQAAPGAGSSGTQAQTTAADNSCLWSLGFVGCVLKKSQARALLAGLMLGGGLVIGLVGLNMLLKAAGLGGSGIGKAAASGGEMLALFPPAEGAAVAMSAAGGRANRVAAHRARGRTAATGERRAATGEANAVTSARRAATGETNARTAQRRASTYKYRSRTDREVGRSRAKTYRKDAGTRRYAAETGRQREQRLATRRSQPRTRNQPAPAAAPPAPAFRSEAYR